MRCRPTTRPLCGGGRPGIRHVTCCLFPLRHRPVTNPFRFRLNPHLERSPVRPIRVASLAVGAAAGHRASDRLSAPASIIKPAGRPCVHGKFLFVGNEKLYIRGVTYGTFRPRADGTEVPEPDVVERDFAAMAANGFNAVRLYSVPPIWLLDAPQRHGLPVMIGLPVERYIGFLAE